MNWTVRFGERPKNNRPPPTEEERRARIDAAISNPRRPRYVQACEAQSWHLRLNKLDPRNGELGPDLRVAFKCHSWRHPGDCRRWVAAQNFSRITEALKKIHPRAISLAVLTLRPRDWKHRWEAFEELSSRWTSLRRAIVRTWGPTDWIGTVEIHKSGWPHFNAILINGTLADAHQKQALAWLKRHAVLCGFGPIASIERARSKRAVAGYVVKVASAADGRGLSAEVTKTSQLPVNAPPHFRRLRSTPGFLPPPRKGHTPMIGVLEREPLPVRSSHTATEAATAAAAAPDRRARRTPRTLVPARGTPRAQAAGP